MGLLQLVQAAGNGEDKSASPKLEASVGDLLVILQSDEANLMKVYKHFDQVVTKVTNLSQCITHTQNLIIGVQGRNGALSKLNRLEETEELTTRGKVCLETVPAGNSFLASTLAKQVPGIESEGGSEDVSPMLGFPWGVYVCGDGGG